MLSILWYIGACTHTHTHNITVPVHKRGQCYVSCAVLSSSVDYPSPVDHTPFEWLSSPLGSPQVEAEESDKEESPMENKNNSD